MKYNKGDMLEVNGSRVYFMDQFEQGGLTYLVCGDSFGRFLEFPAGQEKPVDASFEEKITTILVDISSSLKALCDGVLQSQPEECDCDECTCKEDGEDSSCCSEDKSKMN